LILPGFWLLSDAPVASVLAASLNVHTITWILVGGMAFAYCYVSSWRSFPLIGVARGQAIANFYGVFAVVFISVVTLTLPKWYFLVGMLLVVAGGTLICTESSSQIDVMREVQGASPKHAQN